MDARHLPTVVYERPPPAGSAYPHIHPYRRDPSPQKQQQHPAVSPPIKGKRKRASPQQLEVLNEVFASTSFPSTETRQRLARELGMTPRTVQIWFQNKRQASRQRDGHHSRNTKSMAASAANVNSFGRQYSKSLSPANSKLSHSPSPGAVHYGSSTVGTRMPPHQLQQYTMAPVSAGATARPGPSEYSSAPSPAPSAMTTMAAPAWREPKFKLPRIPEPAMYNSAEYAHTRNDQWFAEETPARLDYLYSHNSPMTMVPPSRGRCELP
ncbi:Short stature homeobox protein 2, partial [Coemansia sp. RSA 552]